MNAGEAPVVGQWYRHRLGGQVFQVVAVDTAAATLELQQFDGTLDELRLVQWYALDVESCEAPQDWTGPFDDVERDDLDVTETQMQPDDWAEPYAAAAEPAAESESPQADSEREPTLLAPELVQADAPTEQLYARARPRKRRR